MLSDEPTHPRPWLEERRRFIEAGGNTTHAFGLGRMIGRLYALLYLTPRPLALEDIAGQLAVSKASASIAVRQLADLRAVRQVWVPGDRRDYYEAETHFGTVLRDGLLPGIRKKLQSAGLQIERTLASEALAPIPPDRTSLAASTSTRSEQAELQQRLRAAQELHRRLDRLLAGNLLANLL